jgi:hypothetical protein
MSLKEAMEQAFAEEEFSAKVLPGQNWIELDGRYTPAQLRFLANKIEAAYAKVPQRGNKERLNG